MKRHCFVLLLISAGMNASDQQHVSPYALICSQEHYQAEKKAWEAFHQTFLPMSLIQLIMSYANVGPTLTSSKPEEETRQVMFWSVAKKRLWQAKISIVRFFSLKLFPVGPLFAACKQALPQDLYSDQSYPYLAPLIAQGKLMLSPLQAHYYLNMTKTRDLRFNHHLLNQLDQQEPLISSDLSEKEFKNEEISWSWKNLDTGKTMSTALHTYHDSKYPRIQWTTINQLHKALRQQGLRGTLLTMQPVLLKATPNSCPWALLKPLHVILEDEAPKESERIYRYHDQGSPYYNAPEYVTKYDGNSSYSHEEQPTFVLFNTNVQPAATPPQ